MNEAKALIQQELHDMTEAQRLDLLCTDELTGVMSRRVFDRDTRPYVIIVDLDSLKYVNDTHGHRAGDEQIKALAATLVRFFGHDNVYRLSGDEFAVKSTRPAPASIFDYMWEEFPAFSYGAGENPVEADDALLAQKALRERIGLRAARGEKPYWSDLPTFKTHEGTTL